MFVIVNVHGKTSFVRIPGLWRNRIISRVGTVTPTTISRTVPVTQTLSTSTVSAVTKDRRTSENSKSSTRSGTTVSGKRKPISRSGLKPETADPEHITFPSSRMTSRGCWDSVDSSKKASYVTSPAMTSAGEPETPASNTSRGREMMFDNIC